ncbi:uncharacterized protein M421DRAFT_366456 [Didymella exigua CBS 183.55]|uniref:Uncharacterized protein n=1 Tax=Didymella exigua CBS 183.55 TaxID=1150837 RepID=A0A6A5R318_9PLEO|nr:uncharacterized protein M421DRAFT_366456 [Didymella exigua CBS 183.55]KAF1922441.1 hypothetical protein M421DRAFT_366456 [Didymella exigua CBS 183.55]
MLARASSDAGTRLRRSKSTSTVHRHGPPLVEPLDPDIAQHHAIVAATAAFARSHAHAAVERKATRSIEIGRSKSTASRKTLTSQGSHFPPRELSVRSVPAQKSVQTSRSNRFSATSATEKLPSFDPTPRSDRPTSATRPLSAQPSITFSEYARPTSQPKSHRQSAALSITSQQIRKARSMYYASSVQTGSPIARPPAKYLTTPPSVSTSPAPTTYVPTRSTGPSPLAEPRVTAAVALDEAVDTARDKVLQDFQQQQRSIKHKPSLFLAPFKKRQDKSKNKAKHLPSIATSVPSTNYSFADDTVLDITVSDFMPQVEAKDRRSFSGSLKSKIKRVFRRSSAKAPSLPVQQIEASREYFNDTARQLADDHGDIPSPEEHLVRRVRSRTPSSDGGRTHPIRSASRSSSKGSAPSIRSLYSEANASHASTSRVTSWGTSTSGETLTQRAIKRLTVIHEAKDSIGSMTDRPLSASTKRRSLPLPSLSAFKDPMHMESLVEESSTPPVDPKRVFSALMREIDASKVAGGSTGEIRTPGTESDVFESSKTEEIHSSNQKSLSSAIKSSELPHSVGQSSATHRPASVAARSVQSKKGSIKSFRQAIRPTIRTVTPAEHLSPPPPDEIGTGQPDSDTPSSGTSSGSRGDHASRVSLFKRLRIPKKKSADTSIETATPTTTQIEMRVARAKNRWQTPLNESSTPQFPRETDRLYTVLDFFQQQSTDRVTAAVERPPPPKSPPAQLSNSMQTPMSPSIYSRNTDGASILPNDSVVSFNSPYEFDRGHQGGSAVILTSQSVRSYVIGTPSPNRPSSTRSSRDWKAWLSHEVSGIETASQEDITIHQQYATPSEKDEHALNQTIRTSHTGSEDTTVIVRESFETSTPRAEPESTIVLGPDRQIAKPVSQACPDHIKAVPECDHVVADKPKKLPLQHNPIKGHLSTAPVSTPVARRDRSASTPSSSSGPTQQLLGTASSARMNERFPFLDTGKRSSSNNSSRSRLSKSPTSSVGSSSKNPEAAPGPENVYSDVFISVSSSTTTDVPGTAPRRAETYQNSKENMTPTSNAGPKRPHISPLGLVQRPKSLQPLSFAALNRSPTNIAHLSSNAADTSQPRCAPSPAETVIARPGLRVTIRPSSPEKLSRRARSAFDLRQTPSPRPASELRRPALQSKASSRLLAENERSRTDKETSGDGLHDVNQREGSVTPGQRMAERFLKERKSATVLERGTRKSTGKLVREDTPAFL